MGPWVQYGVEHSVGVFGGVSEIYWIGSKAKVTLAVVSCPRGDDKLKSDLVELKVGGIETIVSMLEPDEAAWLGLRSEEKLAREIGMDFVSFPIPDGNVPFSGSRFDHFVADLVRRVNSGEAVGVHCRGSIGRSTVTAACTLIRLGLGADKALAAVQAARGCPVPDTLAQERWILHYRPVL